ncbi:hypothetical protein SAMN05660420_02245 [Desulfuromusa kysingii]|uniref:Uncharacterized protein n=1 Tax=Desulfuromusa kysingii TaxID=37625 RepID=A0A1H4BJZ0_9BACT|nr:hypothetical protein SAMN05660420_02245 [Desulfuromusa kysingii]
MVLSVRKIYRNAIALLFVICLLPVVSGYPPPVEEYCLDSLIAIDLSKVSADNFISISNDTRPIKNNPSKSFFEDALILVQNSFYLCRVSTPHFPNYIERPARCAERQSLPIRAPPCSNI